MAATNPACWISTEPSLLDLDGTQPAGSRRNPACWVSLNPAWLGFDETQQAGFDEPSLAGFPRTQQGWVPTNPAESRLTQPCWVYPNPAIGFDETQAGFQ
ncbi:hypothetical protein SLEP1_g541 [Rubroshorea leprosula]|uniref:Uncharacterized protein n=1 Tax=Rubroshorea leprosula TaxID=152421 RepID=A0AAV5HLA5_9ROSI|nr:hypothetical protein SLEP1_g541 [Rubroshorea leprosula]